MIVIEDNFYILKKSKLFEGMDIREARSIIKCLSAKISKYKKGEYIFSAGDKTNSIGLILSGRVHILNEDFWGNKNILSEIGISQVFGESYACIPDIIMNISVLAQEDTVILFMQLQRVLNTCSSACSFHSILIQNLLKILAEKNLIMNNKLLHVTQRSIREKVLSYLSLEAIRAKNNSFVIPFNRQQMADFLSVDRSALSRELGKMKNEGLLVYKGKSFLLMNDR